MTDLSPSVTDRDGAPLSPPRKMRRDPVPVAIAGIVAVIAACLVVWWWGPLNPSVSASGSMPAVDPGARELDLTLSIYNGAMAPIEVTGVSVRNVDGAVPADLGDPQVESVTSTVPSSAGTPSPTTTGLPFPLPGRTTAEMTVHVSVPRCPGMVSNVTIGGVQADVTIRSAWGMSKVVPVSPPLDGSSRCLPAPSADAPLPTGPGPTDPAAAEAAVRHAYTIVYRQASPPEARTALVDDPSGLAETTAAALAGPSGSYAAATEAVVHQVSFDRPDHAWLTYDLSGTGLPTRVGEAVEVDGTWKVSRATVCADLALAGAVCPPPDR